MPMGTGYHYQYGGGGMYPMNISGNYNIASNVLKAPASSDTFTQRENHSTRNMFTVLGLFAATLIALSFKGKDLGKVVQEAKTAIKDGAKATVQEETAVKKPGFWKRRQLKKAEKAEAKKAAEEEKRLAEEEKKAKKIEDMKKLNEQAENFANAQQKKDKA